MKPLIIAHAEDPDGIIARALLMRHFEIQNSPEEHVLIRYDRIVEAFEESIDKAVNRTKIIIADVNPNQRLVQAGGLDFTLLGKLAADRDLYWFDHHDATLLHKNKLTNLGIKVHHQEKQCAAVMIAQHYRISDLYMRRLAKIAQAHDYQNTSSDHENIQIGNGLEKVIALANEILDYGLLLDLSRDLRDQVFFDNKFNVTSSWQRYIDTFNERAERAYKELDETVEVINTNQGKIIFGYCSPLLSQKPGSFYLHKKYARQADIFVCLFKPPVRNHIILVNNGSSFPVVSFLQSLGGGGRGRGGGFSLDYDITTENYSGIQKMLKEQIEVYSQ